MSVRETIWLYLSTIGLLATIPTLPIPLLATPFLLWFHKAALLLKIWGYAALAWLIIFAVLWLWNLIIIHVN